MMKTLLFFLFSCALFAQANLPTPVTIGPTPADTSAAELRLRELRANGTNYISIKAPDTASSNATIQLTDGGGISIPEVVIDVRQYGADPTGVADSQPAFTAAIAAWTANGGPIKVPAGTFKLNSTLVINKYGIVFEGVGSGGADNWGNNAATTLVWGGAADGTMISMGTASGAGNHIVSRQGLRGMRVDCNASAAVGIKLEGLHHGLFDDLLVVECKQKHIWLSSVAVAIEDSRGSLENSFRNITIRAYDALATSAYGFVLDGDATTNASWNRFENLSIYFVNGTGIRILNGDNNHFRSVRMFRASPTAVCGTTGAGAGCGVYMTNQGAYAVIGNNHFYGLAAAGGFHQDAVNADCNNSVFGYAKGNGEPTPIITTGQLSWTEDDGSGTGWHLAHDITLTRSTVFYKPFGSTTNGRMGLEWAGAALEFAKDRSAANARAFTFYDIGGATSDTSAPYWRGLHLIGPTYTVSAVPTTGRLVTYSAYDTLTDPTVKRWVLEIGGTGGFDHDFVFRQNDTDVFKILADKSIDAAPSGAVNYARLRNLEIYDATGSTGHWKFTATASATNSYFTIFDNGPNEIVTFQRNIASVAFDRALWYVDMLPNADASQSLGSDLGRWDKLYADNVYTSYLDLTGDFTLKDQGTNQPSYSLVLQGRDSGAVIRTAQIYAGPTGRAEILPSALSDSVALLDGAGIDVLRTFSTNVEILVDLDVTGVSPADWDSIATFHDSLAVTLGGFTPATERTVGQKLAGIAAMVETPVTAVNTYTNAAIAGHIKSHSGVGIFGGARPTKDASSIFGGNFFASSCSDNSDTGGAACTGTSYAGVWLVGGESDTNNHSAGTVNVVGHLVSGGSSIKGLSNVGLLIHRMGQVGGGPAWDYGVMLGDAAADTGGILLGTTGTGNSVGSMSLRFKNRTAGAVEEYSSIGSDLNGNLIVIPDSGAMVVYKTGAVAALNLNTDQSTAYITTTLSGATDPSITFGNASTTFNNTSLTIASGGLTLSTGSLTIVTGAGAGKVLTSDVSGVGTWEDATSGLPASDTTNIVKGSDDATKLLRFEIDGFTTATTRVLTPQNADYVLAGTNIANSFSADQTLTDKGTNQPSYSFVMQGRDSGAVVRTALIYAGPTGNIELLPSGLSDSVGLLDGAGNPVLRTYSTHVEIMPYAKMLAQGLTEGGEIQLQGGTTPYPDLTFDSYAGNARVFLASTTSYAFQVFNNGTGVMNQELEGMLTFTSDIAWPGASTKGIWRQSDIGTIVQGAGTTHDVFLASRAGGKALGVITNSVNLETDGYFDAASYVDAATGFKVNGTTVIDNNRNFYVNSITPESASSGIGGVSSRMYDTYLQKLWVGANGTPTDTTSFFSGFETEGTANISYWKYNAAPGAGMYLVSSRGTKASPTAIQSGDPLGGLYLSGLGSIWFVGAGIQASATETWGSVYGTELLFSTVLTGGAIRQLRWSIDGSGNWVPAATSTYDVGSSTYKVDYLHANTVVSYSLLDVRVGVTAPNGVAGYSGTITVRKGDDSGSCTLTVSGGFITATTC